MLEETVVEQAEVVSEEAELVELEFDRDALNDFISMKHRS